MLGHSSQKGFSLIELMMVFVIVGMLATVAVPSLIKSREAAEKGAVIADLRTIHTNQTTYLSQRGRYARLPELNAYFNNSLGTLSSTSTNANLLRGNYTYILSPTPTNTTLATKYQIFAIKYVQGRPVTAFIMDQSGVIDTIIP